MKIIDCFIFYNEFELLHARMHELYDIVDYFVLVEANKTFTGLDKPLLFDQKKELFAKYLDKIIHIKVEDFPETSNPWDRERFQRAAVHRGLAQLSLTDDDIVFLSDSDEIINANIVEQLRANTLKLDHNKIYRLEMALYYYNLEWCAQRKWYHPTVCLFSEFKKYPNADNIRQTPNGYIIRNAGWHMSYYGNVDFIKNKLVSYSETQENTERNRDSKHIEDCMKEGRLFLSNGDALQLTNIPLLTNTNLPKFYLTKAVPKIAFTFWEGLQISWLHYLTVASFMKLNPSFEVRIYYSDKEENFIHGNESTATVNRIHASGINITDTKCITINDIAKLPGVKLIPIDLEAEYGLKFVTSPIHKADITRIIKLYEHGGIWFDFDVFFTKPIPDEIMNSVADIHYFTYYNTVATGLIVARPFTKAIRLIYNKCMEKINMRNINNDWQQFGPTLWASSSFNNTHIFRDCIFRANDEVYPYMWNEPQLFFRTNVDKITDKTWCIHWYNGHSETRKFINEFDIADIKSERSIFERELLRVMH